MRENEKLKADRGVRGTRKRDTGTRQVGAPMMSFEDYSRVKESTTGTATPSSSVHSDMSPVSTRRRHQFG
jgi:hypothetical protein